MNQTQTPALAEQQLWGLLAGFRTPQELINATRAAKDAGYGELRAYTPFPVAELYDLLKKRKSWVPTLAVIGGVLGGISAYALQYFAAVWSYPWNVGGKPHHSWPLFVPVTFEITILGSSLFIFFGMLALNGLPRPYFPTFNVEAFARASSDRFFLSIEASDAKFDARQTRDWLAAQGAETVTEVPREP